MAEVKRFVVKKDARTDVISYFEYEKLKGYTFKPKDNLNVDDLINVSKLVVINPSLIEKLIDKKCKKTLEKIIKMISIIDDEDDDGNIGLVIDMIDHFRELILNKYSDYMDKKEINLLLKKLDILSAEVKLRMMALEEKYEMKQGKGR